MINPTRIEAMSDDRRFAERRDVSSDSTLRDVHGRPIDVIVNDLSINGFRIETAERLKIGSSVQLGLAGVGTVRAIVVRQNTSGYGCETVTSLTQAQLAAAFSSNPVVEGAFPSFLLPRDADMDEPEIARWPAAARVGVIVGSAAALWALIALVI